MSTLHTRIKALQGTQDAQCEACWCAYMRALLACEPAFKRHGVPGDVAERWFEAMPADEAAQIEVALQHMSDEVEAVKRAYRRMTQIEAACGPWLSRKAEADERVLAMAKTLANTLQKCMLIAV